MIFNVNFSPNFPRERNKKNTLRRLYLVVKNCLFTLSARRPCRAAFVLSRGCGERFGGTISERDGNGKTIRFLLKLYPYCPRHLCRVSCFRPKKTRFSYAYKAGRNARFFYVNYEAAFPLLSRHFAREDATLYANYRPLSFRAVYIKTLT